MSIKTLTARELVIKALTMLHEAASIDDRLLSPSLGFLEEMTELYGITQEEVCLKVDAMEKRRV